MLTGVYIQSRPPLSLDTTIEGHLKVHESLAILSCGSTPRLSAWLNVIKRKSRIATQHSYLKYEESSRKRH